MKSKVLFYTLCLAVMAISVPLAAAKSSNLLDMMDQLDKLDKKDMQSLLDKANDCTRARNFSCSEEQLRKAAKLVNDRQDKLALNFATSNLQAEKQRVDQEARARAEQERQARQAELRRREEEDRAEERRRDEERRQDAQASYSSGPTFAQSIQSSINFNNDLTKIRTDAYQDTNRRIQENRDREAAQRRANERAAADLRAEQRLTERTAEDRRTQEVERQRQAQINRNPAPTYTPTVLAQNSVGGGAGNSAGSTRKAGESAQNCVRASVRGETLTFQNSCGEHVFVIWCGDLKYSKKKCGDNGMYYNMSANIEAGGETTAQITGQYRYAACKGGISFGNDGSYRETGNGGVECLKR